MEAVVLVDENWAIGRNGDQPIRIKADLQRFKEITQGGALVYGRKTLMTFPGAKPLPGRVNLLLSKSWQGEEKDLKIFSNEAELMQAVKHLEEEGQKVFLIGGASVYQQLLAYCDLVHVTKVATKFPDCDCWFPNLDQDGSWELVCASTEQTAGKDQVIHYKFLTYKHKR